MKSLILSTYLLLLFSVIGSSQTNIKTESIEEGWKAIKPLQTTRAQIESFLTNPTKNGSQISYETDDALVHITYSKAPCSDIGSGRYKVSQDTVVNYQVVLKKDIKISELKWKKNLYKRDDDPEILQFVDYRNAQDGIKVNAVKLDDGVEKVISISYYPDKKSEESVKCCK